MDFWEDDMVTGICNNINLKTRQTAGVNVPNHETLLLQFYVEFYVI